MTQLSDAELDQVAAHTIDMLQPVLDTMVTAAVKEAVRRIGLVRTVDGTVVDLDGRTLTVQPAGGDGEDELIHCLRTWATQAIDDDVVVLFVPPAGAIALGRLPDPTPPEV
jgi:hypothetical protein